ncbi:MAG: caspase family protein, partial [Mariprofundales bacterium]
MINAKYHKQLLICRQWRYLLLLLITTMIVLLPTSSAIAQRLALVIGNNDYEYINQLNTANADAKAMAKALENVGYDVELENDLNRDDMMAVIRNFKIRIQAGDEALFFYAGHGVSNGTSNYLLPIDIKSKSAVQVADDSLA